MQAQPPQDNNQQGTPPEQTGQQPPSPRSETTVQPPEQSGGTAAQQPEVQNTANQTPLAAENRSNKPSQPKQTKRAEKTRKKDNTTQKSLLISEIRDGIVIMKDGSLRSVVMCQSINFDLMSPQEREGVEYSYQQFLNSLNFPIQIYIRSKHIDLDDYIKKLEQTRQNQDNILLGLLMEDYIAYIRYLIENVNIMDKQFYVIVPYYPSGLSEGLASGAQKFSELFKPKQKDVVTIDEVNFRKYKDELTRQVRTVASGLTQMGIQAVPLNTQELIELYYNVYNPVTSKQQQLGDVNQLESPLVEKGDGEAKQVHAGDNS